MIQAGLPEIQSYMFSYAMLGRPEAWRLGENHLPRSSSAGKHAYPLPRCVNNWLIIPGNERDYSVFARFADRTGISMLVQNPFRAVHRNGYNLALDCIPDMDWQTKNGPFESHKGCIGVYTPLGTGPESRRN